RRSARLVARRCASQCFGKVCNGSFKFFRCWFFGGSFPSIRRAEKRRARHQGRGEAEPLAAFSPLARGVPRAPRKFVHRCENTFRKIGFWKCPRKTGLLSFHGCFLIGGYGGGFGGNGCGAGADFGFLIFSFLNCFSVWAAMVFTNRRPELF